MRTSILLSATVTLFLAACGGSAPKGPTTPQGDDDQPLTSRGAVFHNVPRNESLPNDNKADAVYPPQFTELLAEQSPVRNQAHRGDCTIFSTMGLMEHLYIKAGMATPDFSEQYLNWATKVQYGAYPEVEGSNNYENLQTIIRYGVVDDALDPYNPDPWTEANDPDCKVDESAGEGATLPTKCWTQGDPPAAVQMAPKHKLPSARFINTNSIKANMTTAHTAVVIGLDFYYQAWNHRLSGLPVDPDRMAQGIVQYPNEGDIADSNMHPAGHGILLVGWDDDLAFPKIDEQGKPVVDADGNPVMEKGFYIFKNSWGTARFGVNNPYGPGYGFISYRYVNAFSTANVAGIPAL